MQSVECAAEQTCTVVHGCLAAAEQPLKCSFSKRCTTNISHFGACAG